MQSLVKSLRVWALPLTWLQAVLAMFGSLFFSEVLHYAPCDLCWWQRLASYPLVVILPIALWRRDHHIGLYCLPLTIFGWFVALYQNLIYYHLINPFIRCTLSVPCDIHYFDWFGFISLPLLSLVAFTFMNLLLFLSLPTRD